MPALKAVQPPEPPAPPLRDQLSAAMQARRQAAERVAALEGQAQATGLLSEDEEIELIRLRQRLEHLAPHISRLQKEAGRRQVKIDIEEVQAAWSVLIKQKLSHYEAFMASVAALRQAFSAIVATHRQQEQLVERLPRALQEILVFIDLSTLQARVAQAAGSSAWHALLCSPSPLAVPSVAALSANDPGVRDLPRRILAPFQSEVDPL